MRSSAQTTILCICLDLQCSNQYQSETAGFNTLHLEGTSIDLNSAFLRRSKSSEHPFKMVANDKFSFQS